MMTRCEVLVGTKDANALEEEYATRIPAFANVLKVLRERNVVLLLT